MTSEKRNPYDVGYGRPPTANQFKTGHSGNPRGRPKGARNFATLARKELQTKVDVLENGKRVLLSKGELVVKAQVAKAAKGDARSAEFLHKLEQQGEAAVLRSPQAAATEQTDQDIIDRYIARLSPPAREDENGTI